MSDKKAKRPEPEPSARMLASAAELSKYEFRDRWLKREEIVGDHRATINIKVEFHGKTYEWKDAWINYSGYDGPDSRVIEFFENMWRDGYGRWLDEVHESQEEQRAAKQEVDERETLAALKAKYGEG